MRLLVGLATALALGKRIGLDLIRAPKSLCGMTDDSGAENVYVLEIVNKTERAHSDAVTVAARAP